MININLLITDHTRRVIASDQTSLVTGFEMPRAWWGAKMRATPTPCQGHPRGARPPLQDTKTAKLCQCPLREIFLFKIKNFKISPRFWAKIKPRNHKTKKPSTQKAKPTKCNLK